MIKETVKDVKRLQVDMETGIRLRLQEGTWLLARKETSQSQVALQTTGLVLAQLKCLLIQSRWTSRNIKTPRFSRTRSLLVTQ